MAVTAASNENGKPQKDVCKNNAPFRSCILKINNILIENAEDRDNVMLMYNLLESSDNYSMASGNLWMMKLIEMKLMVLVIMLHRINHVSIKQKFMKNNSTISATTITSRKRRLTTTTTSAILNEEVTIPLSILLIFQDLLVYLRLTVK